jgi:hypothetical protein
MQDDDGSYYDITALVYVGAHAFTLEELWSGVDRLERRGVARRDRARAQPGLGDDRDRARAVRADAIVSDEEFWSEMARMLDLQALVERAGHRYAASIGEEYDPNPFTRPAHQGGYPHITPEEWARWDAANAEFQARRRGHP